MVPRRVAAMANAIPDWVFGCWLIYCSFYPNALPARNGNKTFAALTCAGGGGPCIGGANREGACSSIH